MSAAGKLQLEAGHAVALLHLPAGGKLGTDVNRDSLWELLAGRGIRPVRQVAIDDTWSALRFRPASGGPRWSPGRGPPPPAPSPPG